MITHNTETQQRATVDDRFYEITQPDGTSVFYPSVTNILSDVSVGNGLDHWKQEQAEQYGVEGAALSLAIRARMGSNVHAAVERYNKGEMLEWVDPVTGRENFLDFEWKCLCRYVQWMEDFKVEVLATEMTVFSHSYRYAGTCDLICRIGEDVYVVDVKTSKQVTDTHMLQVAAYREAVWEIFGENLQTSAIGVLALSSRNKCGYQWKEAIDREWVNYLKRFIARSKLFHLEHPNFEPKRDILPVTLAPTHNKSFEVLS